MLRIARLLSDEIESADPSTRFRAGWAFKSRRQCRPVVEGRKLEELKTQTVGHELPAFLNYQQDTHGNVPFKVQGVYVYCTGPNGARVPRLYRLIRPPRSATSLRMRSGIRRQRDHPFLPRPMSLPIEKVAGETSSFGILDFAAIMPWGNLRLLCDWAVLTHNESNILYGSVNDGAGQEDDAIHMVCLL